MAYDVTTVTIKGTELLASASVANNLVVAGCDATQTYISKAAAVNVSARPANPFSNTTNVRLEGATDGHIFIRIFFVANESTGGDVRSLYLYGHSADDPSNDYVIAVMSSEDPFHLPEAGDISNTYGTLLDVKFNVADGSVSSVTTSVFATYSEYADLRDRTVTTHKQGNATQGESQTIYGEKTFINTINSAAGSNPAVVQNFSNSDAISFGSGAYSTNPGYLTPMYFLGTGIDITANPAKHNIWAGGVQRSDTKSEYYLGINSFIDVGSGAYSKFASVRTQIAKNSAYESNICGSVIIEAIELKSNRSAFINIETLHDGSDNPYSQITSAADYIFLKSIDPSNNSNLTALSMRKDSWDILTQIGTTVRGITAEADAQGVNIYPVFGAGENPCVSLGYGSHKFKNVYAESFYGDVIGNVTGNVSGNATNDANGNAITSYFRTWGISDGSTIIAKRGDGTSTSGVPINSACAYSAQGKEGSTSSAYSAVGGIGLFLYTGSATSKAPGDTVSGSDLKPASLMKEYSTGNFKIISSGSVSGTWTLLSYFSTSSSGDAALVLAVKTSTT